MSVYDGASVFPIFIDGVKGAAIGMAISYGVNRIATMGETKADIHQGAGSGEPANPTTDVDANSSLRDNISVVDGEDGTTINVKLTVARDRLGGIGEDTFNTAVDSIRSNWNTSGEYNGASYSMSVDLEVVDGGLFGRGADITITGAGDGSFVSSAAPNTINYDIVTARPATTGAHEFGHVIGLGHRPNSTGSIMSYAAGRRVRGAELHRIANAYR